MLEIKIDTRCREVLVEAERDGGATKVAQVDSIHLIRVLHLPLTNCRFTSERLGGGVAQREIGFSVFVQELRPPHLTK